jgi:hypothetical protein
MSTGSFAFIGLASIADPGLIARVNILTYMQINQRQLCYFCPLSIAYED